MARRPRPRSTRSLRHAPKMGDAFHMVFPPEIDPDTFLSNSARLKSFLVMPSISPISLQSGSATAKPVHCAKYHFASTA